MTVDYGVLAIRWVDPYAWFLISFLVFVLGIIGSSPLNYDHNDERKVKLHEITCVYMRRICLSMLPIIGILVPLCAWFMYVNDMDFGFLKTFETFFSWYKNLLVYWLFAVSWWVIGLSTRFYFVRRWKPKISDFKRKIRVTQKTESLSDIRKEENRYSQKDFLPEEYYKPDFMFWGLTPNNDPTYVSRKDWCETNVKIIGPTRKGKGVALGCLIEQAIKQGDMIWFIDDKGDEYIPHIMADRARKEGRNFFYYDLNDPENDDDVNPGEWAPFVGGNLRSKRSRILVAAGLGDTGNDSDFYKLHERTIVDEILEKTDGRIPLLLTEIGNNEEYKQHAKRLHSFLQEWVKVKSLCPKKNRGLSVEKSILNNAVVYVKGSLDDKIICEAIRILIMEIVQETKRLKNKRTAHLSIFIDEARFAVSKSLADALATILNCKANIILAYQVKSDVRNLEDKNLDGALIEHSINTNCQLTLIYGSADPETNRWIEEMSGHKIKRVVQIERTKIGHLGEETWGDARSIGQEKEALITQNTMLTLDKRIAVLFRPAKLAEVICTSFVPTNQENIFDRTDVVKFSNNEKIIENTETVETQSALVED